MRIIIAIAILIFTVGRVSAAANLQAALWQKGNTFYAQKAYDSAARCYEQIAALKPDNAEVYYNLGNTYYRLNKVALSVLNYERALRINPEYKQAKDNLELAQSRISNHIAHTGDIFFINWWQKMTNANYATGLALSALIIFVLMVGVFMLRRFSNAGKKLPVQIPGLLGFICICLLVLAAVASGNATGHFRAVVMQNDAPLMNNGLKGKPVALVPEGTPVKITDEKDGWAEVSLPDGRNGWLQQGLISKI